MNELLAALVQLGIIDNATAQRINRNLDPAQAQAWAEGMLYDLSLIHISEPTRPY